MQDLGFYKIFSVCPLLKLGNPLENAKTHIKHLSDIKTKVSNDGHALVLFPELSLTGYTCEDLFLSSSLLESATLALNEIKKESKNYPNLFIVVGCPILLKNKLYNCAVTIFNGEIKSVHPKIYIPNYKEFYEKRYFSSGMNISENISILGSNVLFSSENVLKLGKLLVGIEICEDLWSPVSPHQNLVLNGSHLILNLSASNELVGKDRLRKNLIKVASEKLNCAYLYCSSGVMESSKDVVFGGHMLFAENGTIISESKKLQFSEQTLECEVDIEKLTNERIKNKTLADVPYPKYPLTVISETFSQTRNISRSIPQSPFIPSSEEKLEERVLEILDIQSTGLARRLLSIGKDSKMVIGLSGGLDSTLALLVSVKACEKLNIPVSNIHAISMPGFGTSQRTKSQSQDLASSFGVSFKEIDITKTTKEHLKDLDHENIIDVVYENAQARERTQILFDYANKVKGFVVGTSSLSELFCGWTTYNGDHMSNYGPNMSIPKSLVRFMIKHYPATDVQKSVLKRIFETPVSPELLPLDSKKEIKQKTEEIIGPYELIDFYIFHYLRNGFQKEKILFLANIAFKEKYESAYMDKVFKETYKRFRMNQFKRTTCPPGVKVGISLSPRGDLRLPDEYDGDNN